MNMLDRGVLYIGVLLAVALAVVSIFSVGRIKEKVEDILRRKPVNTTTFAGGPIPITNSTDNFCTATPGAVQLDYPATNTALQWRSRTGSPYTVRFKPFQDPSDPHNANPNPIAVPGDGTPSNAISVNADVQHDCSTSQACVYEYTVVPAAATCMDPIGSFGIIINPGG